MKDANIINVIMYWIFGMFVAGAVHESAHLVVGLINGWKFQIFQIGPFLWEREGIEAPIRFSLCGNISRWGGLAASCPAQKSQNNIKVWSKVLIAGPLSSIIFGVIFLTLYHFLKKDIFLMTGLVCLAMGLVTILPIPVKTGITYNDGKRYKRLVSGGRDAAEEIALLNITVDSTFDEKTFKPEPEDIKVLCESDDELFRYFGYYFYYKSLDQESKEKESVRIELDNLRKSGKITRYVLEEFKYY